METTNRKMRSYSLEEYNDLLEYLSKSGGKYASFYRTYVGRSKIFKDLVDNDPLRRKALKIPFRQIPIYLPETRPDVVSHWWKNVLAWRLEIGK